MSYHHYGLFKFPSEGFLTPVHDQKVVPEKYSPPILSGEALDEVNNLVDRVTTEIKEMNGRPLMESPLSYQVCFIEILTDKYTLSQLIVLDNRFQKLGFGTWSKCGSLTVKYGKE